MVKGGSWPCSTTCRVSATASGPSSVQTVTTFTPRGFRMLASSARAGISSRQGLQVFVQKLRTTGLPPDRELNFTLVPPPVGKLEVGDAAVLTRVGGAELAEGLAAVESLIRLGGAHEGENADGSGEDEPDLRNVGQLHELGWV